MQRIAYSIRELVRSTGISRTKIYKEIKAGKLRATKVGSRTIILEEAVKDWLKRAA
jgi:excisionase family DNA binding protein